MRLFIAIEPPRPFKAEAGRIQNEVRRLSSGGRFVPEENFHITLHFIGESRDTAGAAEAMIQAARGIRPFELHLGKYFRLGGGGTAALRVLGDLEELRSLKESLESALWDRGFSRESKRFAPHITLGRSVETGEAAAESLKSLSPNASMSVRAITLFESRRDRGLVTYIPIHTERL